MLVESYNESAGFSEGSRELAPTNTENTADDVPTDTMDTTTTEHTKRDLGEHAEDNGYRTEENKGSTEHKLKANNLKSKSRSIPKNQDISVVFNYSKIKLTKAMESLLNRGFNFSILPLKLDITQVLVDFKRFERSVILHEYFYGTEKDGDSKARIFKSKKNNMPKNYKTPEGLKTYLGSVKSEIMDHRNRNNVECNLPQEEIQAIKELIKLQKDKVIVIKPCDKGAGMIILDYPVYIEHVMNTWQQRKLWVMEKLNNIISELMI